MTSSSGGSGAAPNTGTAAATPTTRPGARSASGTHPPRVRNGWLAVVRTSRPLRVRTRYTRLMPSSTNALGTATSTRRSSVRVSTETASPAAPARYTSAAVRTSPVAGSTIGVSNATHFPIAGRAPTTTRLLGCRPESRSSRST